MVYEIKNLANCELFDNISLDSLEYPLKKTRQDHFVERCSCLFPCQDARTPSRIATEYYLTNNDRYLYTCPEQRNWRKLNRDYSKDYNQYINPKKNNRSKYNSSRSLYKDYRRSALRDNRFSSKSEICLIDKISKPVYKKPERKSVEVNCKECSWGEKIKPYLDAKYHEELTQSLSKRWSSEESFLLNKSDSGFGKSDSDHSRSSPKNRKVSISSAAEILNDIPIYHDPRPTHSSIKSDKPLKSALKTKPKFENSNVNFFYQGILNSPTSEEDIYDPSLPYIPLDNGNDSSFSHTKKVVKDDLNSWHPYSKESRLVKYNPMSHKDSIACVNWTSVDDWHKTILETAKLGWCHILYLAVRSNYKPDVFARLYFQGSRDFVRAIADYVTREPTLLSFRKGDVIRVTNTNVKYSDKGWLHGVLDGRSGMFPVEYVTHIGRTEARLSSSKNEGIESGPTTNIQGGRNFSKSPEREDTSPAFVSSSEGVSGTTWTVTKGSSSSPHHEDSGHSSGGEVTDETQKTSVDDGKHSLFQFALQHFRGAKESGIADGSLQMAMQKAKKKKGSKEGTTWTWKDLVELVKFSQSPLKLSLLSLEGELNSLAVETFTAIMRYMGDFPMDAQQTEVHCVYFILMNCHKHETLRDEVYCQVMKQTTNNKSSILDSCQRGWRLFSIIAAYFTCSDMLKPYLLKYLETNAYDKRRAFHGTAMVCLQNIRKTFRYGGRKNVPSIEEITAITAGRNSKRQIYRLPGGTERVINTKSTSVVQDILEELCALINVRSQQEQEEFSLYCIVDGDSFTMPLAREEYVLDVTTELLKNKQIFYLVFCRSVYYYPLRLDNSLYIEVVFSQIAPDYLAGFLLVTPGDHLDQDVIYDVAKIAALMHRAADLDHTPTIKEVKYLLPRPLLKARDVKPPAWVSLVQGSWVADAMALSCTEAKAAVLEILQKWPLFGSAFFDVQRVSEPEDSVHTILALNKGGVHFLEPATHESLLTFPLDKIMSTRKVKGNDGELYLDMKCGNLMKPKIITLKTNQAHEISRQIRQYITIEQRFSGGGQGDNPRDVTLTR